MFSRIFRSSAALLFPYKGPIESVSSLQVEQQIQTELEQAAGQGMVSTRSQDNTPAAGASQPSKILHPRVVVLVKKRKIDNGGDGSPVQNVTKRRRGSTKSNGNAAPSSGTGKPGRPRKRTSEKIAIGDAVLAVDHNQSHQEPSTQGSPPDPPQAPANTTEQTIDYDKNDRAIEFALDKPNNTLGSNDEDLEAHEQVKSNPGSATRSRKDKRSKKSRDSDRAAGVNGVEADISTVSKEPQISSATAAKATHKRFGSEEIDGLGTIPSDGIEEREGSQRNLSDEDESEDEAPEALTASAGFEKARMSALDAAKVAARQEADKKARRRDRDQRLRLQAESAKKFRSKDKPSSKVRLKKGSLHEASIENGSESVEKPDPLGGFPQTINDEGQMPQANPKSIGKTPLPLLLPKEILAAEPVVHAPLPPFRKSKLAMSQKRKFLDPEPKPPKDIKRGNVNIRVLEDHRSSLPPKSSQTSKALRESWLTGRPGFKGAIQVPRKKPNGGFVRKK